MTGRARLLLATLALATAAVLSPVGVLSGSAATCTPTPVAGPVTISGTVDVCGYDIGAGGTLTFDPNVSTTVHATGNVIVRAGGRLVMHPASRAVVHRLQFVGITEANYVGGGMVPLATDVGLWSVDGGLLDLVGTPVAGWNRTGTDPTWVASDELLTAPSAAGDFRTFSPYTMGAPLPTYKGQTTEAFDLTRNVIIGGTSTGRAHVAVIHSTVPQVIKWVRIEHVGPRKVNPDNTAKTEPVLGRYGLHFHMGGDGTRGSLVQGVVITDCAGPGFVAHASDGVTFRDTVGYDQTGRTYWWDPDDKTTAHANQSDDVTYDHAAAFRIGYRVKAERGGLDTKLTAFHLGQTVGSSVTDSVAAGVWSDGQPQPSGMYWDENANQEPNVWRVDHMVVHNSEVFGLFAWQNDPGLKKHHVITDSVAWRNGEAGVNDGAYIKDYQWQGLTLLGNGDPTRNGAKDAQLVIHPGLVNTYGPGVLDADGMSPSVILVKFHQSPITDNPPALVHDVDLRGAMDRAIRYDGDGYPGGIDYVRVTVSGQPLQPTDFRLDLIDPAESIRVQQADGSAYRLNVNGTATPIPAFA